MGYIEDNLLPGEHVVAEARQSPLIYFWAWALGVVGCVTCLLAVVFTPLTLIPGVVLVLFEWVFPMIAPYMPFYAGGAEVG